MSRDSVVREKRRVKVTPARRRRAPVCGFGLCFWRLFGSGWRRWRLNEWRRNERKERNGMLSASDAVRDLPYLGGDQPLRALRIVFGSVGLGRAGLTFVSTCTHT